MDADDELMMNDELMSEFIDEAKEHLETLESGLLKLEEAAVSDPDLVSELFRAMHSIKGAAGFLEFGVIVEISHTAENLLSTIREGVMQPSSDTVDALLESCDIIGRLLVDGEKEVDSEAVGQVMSLLTAQSPDGEKASEAAGEPSKEKTREPQDSETESRLVITREEDGLVSGRTLFLLHYEGRMLETLSGVTVNEFFHDLNSLGTIIRIRCGKHNRWEPFTDDTVVPEDIDKCDVLLATPLDESLLQDTCLLPEDNIQKISRADYIVGNEPEPVSESKPESKPEKAVVQDDSPAGKREEKAAEQPPKNPPAKPVVKAGKPKKEHKSSSSSASVSGSGRTVRVNVDLMDNLMALAGELVLVRNQQLTLQEACDNRMRDNIQRLDLITSQLQESIMLTRMQPVGNLFDKIPRIVRDIARKLDKDIQLQVEGNEVELDKIILENLSDPITHLIRNSCDHGIEHPEKRIAVGKSTAGTVIIRAFQESGHINIEIKDDGQGIDPEKIRAKALAQKMYTAAELEAMRDKQVVNLIMEPGFSTAEQLSDISGRGVGMDVVKSCIESLGGNIEISSKTGLGSSIILRLPLTLAIIPSLIIRSGEDRFAIPQVSLEELVAISPDGSRGAIEVAHDQEFYRLRNQLLPLVRLSEILHRSVEFDESVRREIAGKYSRQKSVEPVQEGENIQIAVVKRGSERFGLIVDEIYDTEEIVVKPIHGVLKRLHCFSGCTIMGDGRVAFILDVEGIGKHADIQFTQLNHVSESSDSRLPSHIHSADDVHDIIIFRYGPQEQFAIPLTMIQRIETITAEDIQRVGSREFVTLDGMSTYVLRLDRVLEVSSMPEASPVMKLLVCKYIDRPVGILISDIVDTDEAQIHFRSDCYRKDGLLGSMVINNCITLFLDIFRLVEKAEPDWFAARRRNTPTKQRRVLLVEDAEFFRHVVGRYLEDGGFEVVTASNGRDALILLSKERFDIVVSDLVMPEMDGWSLAEEIRRRTKKGALPLLALSGLQSEADMSKAIECGFDRYVPKFDKESFLTSVIDLIAENPSVGLLESDGVFSI